MIALFTIGSAAMSAWAWTPWRIILSEEAIQVVVARRGAHKREMLDLVAAAAG